MSFPLSVLDLSPVVSGARESRALWNTLELAKQADSVGYHRYWLAEHHSIPSVVSTAPEVLIGQVANSTRRIRVGSGGIMLPNHSPLRIAETFRVLETFHPGRLDLGLGRAPGSNSVTALALRRSRDRLAADDFSELVDELVGYGNDSLPINHPFASVRAMPTDVPLPPIWILGSTEDGAGIAAEKGLGFVFAHHISPELAVAGARVYRDQFRASRSLAQPRLILALSVVCAETDAEAQRLAATMELSWLRLRTGRPGPLVSPEDALAYPYTLAERQIVQRARRHFLTGSPQHLREQIEEWIIRVGADEAMLTTMIHDQGARIHSYKLLAEAFDLLSTGTEEGVGVKESVGVTGYRGVGVKTLR